MNEDLRLHREAELFMGPADQARVQCRPRDAARFDREAAELEAQVFDLLPLDRPKTRGVTAIGSVALYRLAPGNLPEFARLDLEEMVEERRAELNATAAVERLPS